MTFIQFFNQHSFVITSGVLLAMGALVLRRRRARRAWLVWIGLFAVAAIGWLTLRTGEGLQLNSTAEYEAAIRSGQPTLVEFYSNY